MNTKLFFTFLLFITATLAKAQTGKIIGKVVDASTSETLIGATVLIEGTTTGVNTDVEGNFSFKTLNTGKYSIVVRYIGFTTKIFADVEVKDKEVTVLNVVLEQSTNQSLKEVIIRAEMNKENTNTLLVVQKNSATVSDGISAESIKKTPDKSTSDVLKRISGASIQDNKFAIIRGLSDRYNAAYINGTPLPSSESDKKAFAFDIFPANMLDNLVILKTATPDMPGEFAGGIINITTKGIPEKNFQSISVGSSYNTVSTGRDFKTYAGGKFDWLGMDDGTRGLSKDIVSTKDYALLKADDKAAMAKNMTPSWKIDTRNALPGLSLQYALGRNYKLFKKEFGVMFAYTYQNSFNVSKTIRREFEEQAVNVIQKTELKDSVYTQAILNSALLNFAYNVNENNQIGFKNMYSINADDKVTIRNGVRDMDSDPKQWEKSSNRAFTQNNLYTGQLEGTHFIPKAKIKFKWIGGYSDVNRSVPNQSRMVYQKSSLLEGDTIEKYLAVVQNNGTIPTAAGNMFWSNTKEKIYSGKYEFSMPVTIGKVKNEFKIGGASQVRERDFTARNFGFSRYKKTTPKKAGFDNSLLAQPEDSIFASNHLGLMSNGKGGFKLEEATKVSDSYQASSTLHAGFAMFDTRFLEKFRLVGGVRLESYQQKFNYVEFGSNLAKQIDTTVVDLLPSLNFIYSINDKMNLRASYYRTVSRPEFRELAPFAFYNYQYDNILSGNTNLQRAIIDNMDLRYELFPGAGQVLSVSGFYKAFTNPIELIMRTGTSGAAEMYYTNVAKATNYGAEFEYRIKLSAFCKNDSNIILDNTTLFTNATFIKSKVDVSGINGQLSTGRALQGQSPFIVNAGVQYIHPTQDWSVNASYNVVGPRIVIVGNVQEPDVYENSRNVIDLQAAKTFKKKLEIKFSVKDILAQNQLFYQNVGNSTNKGYDKATDNRWQETFFGRTFSVSLSLKF
jgi:TonB-dependent receptor